MTRLDARAADALRPTRITPNYLLHPEGSVLIEVGKTKVICAATVEEKVPTQRAWLARAKAPTPPGSEPDTRS